MGFFKELMKIFFWPLKLPEAPELPPMPEMPTGESEGVQEARLEARRLAEMRRGRVSTILTGSSGLSQQALVRKKTLLGQ